jgi:3-keto-disaccharide hydrolase
VKTTRWPLFVLTLACLSLMSSPLPADEEGFVPLFDGKTLNGFVQRGGKATYRVEDGAVVGTTVLNTPNSFLCTDRDYANFILELEFKVDSRMNSGVQIRSQSLDSYNKGRVHGYQVEIDPSERAWTGGIYDEGRRGWLYKLDKNDSARAAFKQNEWNKFRVVCDGDSIKTWINGVPAADLHDSMTPTGFIALQVHGTKVETPMEVRWRNIRIKTLPDSK